MKRIYTKDDAAPDAQSAETWLEQHLGVKDLYFNVIIQSQVSFKIHEGDGDDHVFEYNGVYYVLRSSCGKFEDVFTATVDEVKQLIDQYRDTLTKPQVVEQHRAVRSFRAQYFKPYGKFHTNGKFDLEVEVLKGGTVYMADVTDYLKRAQQEGTLPGFMPGCGQEDTIYVTHEEGFPCLIPPLL